MAYKDYYQILGVSRSATPDELKQAFKQLARKHHPDVSKDPQAEERFKEINEAYTVLSDPQKREYYDQYGAGGPPPGGFSGQPPSGNAGDFSDFFQQLFGGRGPFGGGVGDFFGQAGRGPRRRDLESELTLSLEQAFHGGERLIQVGGERLTVTIPAGIRPGQKIRLAGRGQHGGDLLLVVRLQPGTFRLEGDDIYLTVEVPVPLAVLGGPLRVNTLDGEVNLNLPRLTQNGRKIRLAGKGWPRKGGSRGDQYLEVRLVLPTQLSPQEEELYRQLAELGRQAADS